MSSNPHELEGVRRRERRPGFPWIRAAVFLLVCFAIALPFTPLPGKIKRGLKEILRDDPPPERTASQPEPAPPAPPPAPPETASPPGTLPPLVVPAGTDIRKLSSEIDLRVNFEPVDGGLASAVRGDDDSYTAEYTLRVTIPSAADSLEDLRQVNPLLGAILPGLEEMLPGAAVSQWFPVLYTNKSMRLRKKILNLDELLSRHNFYDCETMLTMTAGGSDRRVFLMQAEMDVVSDGSDGDRLPEMPEKIVNSTNYQPFTSYGWRKTGDVPNPMIAGWERRIATAREEMARAETTPQRRQWLQDRVKMLEGGIRDMKARSFLVAEYDPFIVIPVNVLKDRADPFAPNVGDYAVVIHGKRVFPVIVGDGGPTFKVGEGSLRLAKEINPKAGIYSRPVSDLTVTYLVFPRSAEKSWRQPDYAHWRSRCEELLGEIGGLGDGYVLHEWADLFPKKEESAEEAGEPAPPSGPE
ncbi:MAG: hypothetical protein HKO57_04390 [Akkermansiaceae bacterium]|nr:hypothetical protein [Akkermansiaceae bacterium]